MLPRVVEIEVHLPGISVGELADLEVNYHQAAEPAVEEEEVDAIPLVADAQATLATDEGKLAAQLEEEGLEVVDERLSRSFSEYSSLRPRNSRTSGSRTSSSALRASPGFVSAPLESMAALFLERPVRS